MIARIIVLFLMLVISAPAWAQNQGQIVPSGRFTPGHTVRCQNSTCTVAVDAGGSAGSSTAGVGYLTELGITNTGTPFCINDALINSPSGYHQFCIGANALGGGIISYNAVGGATALPLQFFVNGALVPIPGTITGLPQVINNTALQSYSTSSSAFVVRDSFANAGDAPPLFYYASSNPCSLASGAGDNGSQVRSADGKCWLAVFPTSGLDIRQWGAVGDWNGSTGTDNTTAIQNALTYAVTRSAKVIVPPASFKMNSQISVTFAGDGFSLNIEGAGQDQSELVWTASSGGLVINYVGNNDSVNASYLTFATNQNGGGTGLQLNQTAVSGDTVAAPQNSVQNVTFRGSDGYSGTTHFWTIGNQIKGVNNVNWYNFSFIGNTGAGNGTGIDLEPGGSGSFNGAAYNVVSSNFICASVGIKYGTLIQGLSVTGGSNFTCGGTGILVPSGETALDQLTVIGNQFGSLTYGIRDQTGVNGTIVQGNLFITSNANSFGASFEANTSRTVTGNECQAGSATSTCFKVTAGGGIFSNNNIVFQNLGFSLGSSSTGVIVDSTNTFLSTTTSITNSSTSNQVYGDFAFSPVVFGESTAGTPTYGADSGVYHQNANHITANFYVTINALGGMSGNMDMSGFPGVNNASIRGNCSFSVATGFGGSPVIGAYIEDGASPVIAKLVVVNTGGQANSYTAPVTLVGQCDYFQ